MKYRAVLDSCFLLRIYMPAIDRSLEWLQVPSFLDADSDGDGIEDRYECEEDLFLVAFWCPALGLLRENSRPISIISGGVVLRIALEMPTFL